jgi:hypothetical protein
MVLLHQEEREKRRPRNFDVFFPIHPSRPPSARSVDWLLTSFPFFPSDFLNGWVTK